MDGHDVEGRGGGPENGGGAGKRATRRKIVASGANEGPSAPRGGPLYDVGATPNNAPRRGRGRGALDDGVLVDGDDALEEEDLFGEAGDHDDDAFEEEDDDSRGDGADVFEEDDDDRREDDDDEEEDDEGYASWGEWVADYKRVVVGLFGVALVFLGVLYFGWRFVSGGGDEEAAAPPPAPAPREEERPGESAGGPAAKDAGELKVVVPAGGEEGPVEVTLSESEARAEASSWSGEVTKRRSANGGEGGKGSAEGGYAAVTLSGGGGSSSWASCTSVVSEQGARSWMCNLKDTTMQGLILTASQNSDPGPAALEGRMPFLGGRYLVKSTDGSFSASGDYEDVLLDESTMERTYEETYLDDTGEPKRRTLKAEYKVSGDAGLLPAPVGYEPPPGTAPAGGSS